MGPDLEGLAWTLLAFVLLIVSAIAVDVKHRKPLAYDRWFNAQPPAVQERICRRAALLPNAKDSYRYYQRRYRVDPLYAPQMQDQAELRWLLRYGDPKYREFAVLQINEARSR